MAVQPKNWIESFEAERQNVRHWTSSPTSFREILTRWPLNVKMFHLYGAHRPERPSDVPKDDRGSPLQTSSSSSCVLCFVKCYYVCILLLCIVVVALCCCAIGNVKGKNVKHPLESLNLEKSRASWRSGSRKDALIHSSFNPSQLELGQCFSNSFYNYCYLFSC